MAMFLNFQTPIESPNQTTRSIVTVKMQINVNLNSKNLTFLNFFTFLTVEKKYIIFKHFN